MLPHGQPQEPGPLRPLRLEMYLEHPGQTEPEISMVMKANIQDHPINKNHALCDSSIPSENKLKQTLTSALGRSRHSSFPKKSYGQIFTL